jgi:hypothetical protein
MPPAAYLRACLAYSRKTGELHWKLRPREHFPLERFWKRWNALMAGTSAGSCIGGNACRIGIAGYRRSYATHRIIWKLVTGKEPVATVDHIDGNFRNNRWSNLRQATPAENQWNSVRRSTKLKSPYRGAYQSPGDAFWWSSIKTNGVKHYLGTFATAEEAAAAWNTAARKQRREFFPSRE